MKREIRAACVRVYGSLRAALAALGTDPRLVRAGQEECVKGNCAFDIDGLRHVMQRTGVDGDAARLVEEGGDRVVTNRAWYSIV